MNGHVDLVLDRGFGAPRPGGGPVLRVEPDRILYAYAAMLLRPVEIPRANVHSVWLRPFHAIEPRADGWRDQAPLQRVLADVHRRSTNWPVDARTAPDLGGLWTGEYRNLLLVFNTPIPFAPYLRPGRAVLRAIWTHTSPAFASRSTVPTRRSIARGAWGRVTDIEAAQRAFAEWPTADEIPGDVLSWLRPAR